MANCVHAKHLARWIFPWTRSQTKSSLELAVATVLVKARNTCRQHKYGTRWDCWSSPQASGYAGTSRSTDCTGRCRRQARTGTSGRWFPCHWARRTRWPHVQRSHGNPRNQPHLSKYLSKSGCGDLNELAVKKVWILWVECSNSKLLDSSNLRTANMYCKHLLVCI